MVAGGCDDGGGGAWWSGRAQCGRSHPPGTSHDSWTASSLVTTRSSDPRLEVRGNSAFLVSNVFSTCSLVVLKMIHNEPVSNLIAVGHLQNKSCGFQSYKATTWKESFIFGRF